MGEGMGGGGGQYPLKIEVLHRGWGGGVVRVDDRDDVEFHQFQERRAEVLTTRVVVEILLRNENLKTIRSVDEEL